MDRYIGWTDKYYVFGATDSKHKSSAVALLELYEVIDLYSGLNRLNIGLETKIDEKTFESDKRLIGLNWLNILFMLESKLESELIVPVMDAGFEKNMKQMTKQFSLPMKTVNVMREAGLEKGISIKNSKNILDVFYADSEFSIFTQLADVVSGLRRITETSNHNEQLITTPFNKHLLPISQHLLNTPMREEIVALNLNGKVQGPSTRTNTS